MMLGEDARLALAKSLSASTSGPGRRAVAATAGVLQRRLVRAHAQRRRLRTTRVAARPSEEQRDDERHADSAIREFFFWIFRAREYRVFCLLCVCARAEIAFFRCSTHYRRSTELTRGQTLSLPRRPRLDLLGQQLVRQVLSVA